MELTYNFRHTTIRDFQVRLEQLGALMAEPSVLDEVEKPFLDTKVLIYWFCESKL